MSTLVQGKTRIKRLRCFRVGCNDELSRRHLLPTSEPLKTQCIEANAPPVYLNAFMVAQIGGLHGST